MKALQKNQAEKISRLINDIAAAKIMRDAAKRDGSVAGVDYFRLNQAVATKRLVEMGIHMPAMDTLQFYLDRAEYITQTWMNERREAEALDPEFRNNKGVA